MKLFTPDANATWLLTELDPVEPDRAFGLCDLGLGYPELGVRLRCPNSKRCAARWASPSSAIGTSSPIVRSVPTPATRRLPVQFEPNAVLARPVDARAAAARLP